MSVTSHPDADAPRPLRPVLLRGWRRRCPSCGKGAMMRGYLAVRPRCEVCGEDLSHQRADDGPAYATVLIVGHIMAPLLLFAFVRYRPDPYLLAGMAGALCIGLSLFLLPRLKGMFVALQWALRLHGFGGAGDARN
ncbi:MAG: DUF983 domain-containing protein [Paracoccaceae bacterium]